MSEPHENLEIVFVAWLEAIRRGELDEAAARLGPEVTWQGVEPHLRCEDRDQVMDVLRARIEAGTPRVERLELEAAGDRVLLGIAGPDFDSIGDVPLSGEVFLVFTLRAGRIVGVHDYRAREEARRAAGLVAASGD
jgi:SnoaL-like domain